MTVRLMSDGELSRLEVLRDLDQKRLTTEAAAQVLGLERRQVSCVAELNSAAGRGGVISATRACSKSADRFWEWGQLTVRRNIMSARRAT